MNMLPSYVLITPARDEAKFIGLTIKSMIEQTVLPIKWVIVSDGSTDGTDDIVRFYVERYPWIELVRMPERRERTFAGKVYAFNSGYERVRHLAYDVIGCMDADISFDSEYFAFLLAKLSLDPQLGLVGTPFKGELNDSYDYRYVGLEHVSGACQLFRKECFEDIGGYVAVREGGIDHIAQMTARMKGWKTRTFTEKASIHHREMGTAEHGIVKARFKSGTKDYAFGGHPVWELFRVGYQMTKRPYVVGGAMLACGYLWALMRRRKRPISRELVAFRRREQLQRLRRMIGMDRSPVVPVSRPH
jgi:glycosyltransferase involved in cell wall biosynthesis